MGRGGVGAALAVRMRSHCRGSTAPPRDAGVDAECNDERWLTGCVAPNATTFVDVGANVGAWSRPMLAKMRAPEIGLLIEPSSSAVGILREQFRQSPVVEIVHAAASDCIGEASFY